MFTSNFQFSYPCPRGGGASCPGWFILPPAQDLGQAVSSVNSYCTIVLEYLLVVRDVNITSVKLRCLHPLFSLVTLVWGMGRKLSRLVYLAPYPGFKGGLSCPQPRISERKDNTQILLHHLLQEYLVERDINFISVNLRAYFKRSVGLRIDRGLGASCPGQFILPLVNLRFLLQTFSWITYWQGVGGKLSRAVYLAPRPEFQREWIISNFYYIINTEIFSWKGYKLYFSQVEMLTSNVQLGYVLTRGGGKLSRAVYLAPHPEF